jgi:uncharacterized protein (DUF302 family)
MNRILCAISLFLFSMSFAYAESNVYVKATEAPLQETVDNVREALQQNNFFVVYEINIGENLKRFAKNWGEDFNKNKLEGIHSLVFCNGWYANLVSNEDPEMLGLCPLRITITHKKGLSKILFVKPTVIAQDSKALWVAQKIEKQVIKALDSL